MSKPAYNTHHLDCANKWTSRELKFCLRHKLYKASQISLCSELKCVRVRLKLVMELWRSIDLWASSVLQPLAWIVQGWTEYCIFVYLGVRAHQHLRSLAPVMKWEGWLWWPNNIRGPFAPKASSHLSYREEKPRKNLTQETCPDWGSNPGPLRDKRACYHLFHSGGRWTV